MLFSDVSLLNEISHQKMSPTKDDIIIVPSENFNSSVTN